MLVKWDPYTEFEKTVDGLFGSALSFRPVWDDRNREVTDWHPAVNVFEDKEQFAIEAQLPGIDLPDVELSVKEQTVRIRGERKVDAERTQEGYHLREARYGKFSREVRLPSEVDTEEAKATYEKGVLTVRIPKKEKAKPRSIHIEAK